MRNIYFSLATVIFLSVVYCPVTAQTTETISADSVKITNASRSAELILENSSRQTPGFLFNKGNGRTEFRRALLKLNDSTYIIGADTLKVAPGPFVSLNRNEIVPSVKVFSPALSATTSAAVAGTIFAPSFTTAVTNTRLIGADFNKPVITNPGAFTTQTYAARFRDYVYFDSLVYFPGGQFDHFGVRTNSIRAVSDAGTFLLYKPSGNGSAGQGQLLGIYATYTIRTSGNVLTAGTAFKDSVVFSTGIQDYAQIKAVPSLIQQGTASGPLRGLYVLPGLTGITDFRGVEVTVNAGNGYAFYAPGSAPSRFGGLLQYLGNFAASYTDRSLVDKRYADSLFALAGGWQKQEATSNIYYNGRVAVGGMVSPDTSVKLTVHGTVLAKRVRVSANAQEWPDYVFDTGYAAPSAAAIRSFIAENKHLPELPSAAEVEKKGVDVVNMQAALLKKIEELTLLLMEQDDTIRNQSKRIQTLERKLKGK